MKCEHAFKSTLMCALYSDEHEDKVAAEKIVDVWVCKMRKKLKPFGIEISTLWGQGYYFTADAKERPKSFYDLAAPQERRAG